MKSFKVLFILFFAAYSGLQAQTVQEKFQSVLDSIYAAHPETLGIMAHVHQPSNDVAWSGAAGHPEMESEAAIDPEQPALIASNTKTFVAAAILQLQAQKKLTIHQSIKTYLPVETIRLLDKNAYRIDSIKIENLMSHTSGIQDYANDAYIEAIAIDPKHRWSRTEQIALAMDVGPPLGFPGSIFEYSDTNYLLLTEIIEQVTGKPFYTAIRELLLYKEIGLHDTWFVSLEEKPKHTLPLVYQYWNEMDMNSYGVDVSVDLYGGGGIGCSTRDLALFNYKLFNGEIIKDRTVLNLIYTDFPLKKGDSHYHLGITDYEMDGQKAFGHGGFWGSKVMYFPELNACISVYVLVRDERKVINEVMADMLEVLISE